jgi:hypothetical protein
MLGAWNKAVQANSTQSKGEQVVQGLKALRGENIKITTRLRKADRAVYQAQYSGVREVEARLERDWNDLQAWEQLNEAQSKLEEIRMDKLERKKMQTGATWARMGDKCTRKFFQYHKARRPKTKIKELLDGGRSLRTQDEIAEYVQTYYQQLYKFDALCEINIRARTHCLKAIPTVVTTEQNEFLT